MEKYTFRAMGPEEADRIVELVRARIAWMDREGLRSWNTSDYLNVYPPAYYEDRARQGRLFGLVRVSDGAVVCAGVLLEEDERWPDGLPAVYVHHLVSALDARGTGCLFLARTEDWARRRGLDRLRLDCYVGNQGINAYYEALGYLPAGTCADGPYHGTLREKRIKIEGGATMKQALEKYRKELESIKEAGTWKGERIITTPQTSRIDTTAAKRVVNMCANNYLGLSNHPELIAAAKASYDNWGYGLSSVRFICGTQSIHKELEGKLAEFLGMDDAILYSSCFDANGGLFETLLGPEDAVISDELNHASIIDGVRLCKAKRFRYKNSDMSDLRAQLEAARDAGCQVKLIATDGVFSMDGYIANLKGICDLADEFDALVMVDDSHAVGFMGDTGRGTPEFCGVQGRVDILTGTFGKALGGASGGYTAARQEIVDLLRQRSRPYLFSNTVAPAICAASIKTIELLTASTELRDRVHENTAYFRAKLSELGFDVLEGSHPIVAVMLYDAKVAGEFAARMLEKGVYVVGFSYPVVPQGKARIRTQVSAGHTREDLDFAVECFKQVKAEMGL